MVTVLYRPRPEVCPEPQCSTVEIKVIDKQDGNSVDSTQTFRGCGRTIFSP